MHKVITVKAPTRIDLAGGTLDISPLSSIYAPAKCINLGINLYATVTAKRNRKVDGVLLYSAELKRTIEVTKKVAEAKKTLFHRAFLQFAADGYSLSGWQMQVQTLSPAGAGLGGSSALLVAVIRTLCKMSGRRMNGANIVDMAKNIEARHLGIPTGIQDYIAAINGGLSVIEMGEGGMKSGKVAGSWQPLAERLTLVYSGKSRISGRANWSMFKKAMDGNAGMTKAFSAIAANSIKMEAAVTGRHWANVGKLMDVENEIRESFGKDVMPVKLKKLFASLRKSGTHPKICGAGGGGCFAVLSPLGKQAMVREMVMAKGMLPLPFKVGTPSVSSKG